MVSPTRERVASFVEVVVHVVGGFDLSNYVVEAALCDVRRHPKSTEPCSQGTPKVAVPDAAPAGSHAAEGISSARLRRRAVGGTRRGEGGGGSQAVSYAARR